MLFSVIVAFLNEEQYIEQCIKSLVRQDFSRSEYELIFVNNGSTDASAEIVSHFPEISLIQENKKGAYAARNRGLKEARGEIIAFTDADCAVSKNWLMQIYQGMQRTCATIVLGRCCFPSHIPLSLQMFEDYENAKLAYVLQNCAKKYFFAGNGNMAVKRIAFEQHGYFLPWIRGADTEFLQRCIARQNDLKVVYLNEMKIVHLEINNINAWFKKINLYGQHNRRVQKMCDYAPLDFNTKLQIFKSCAKNNYSFWQNILFFFLLIIGNIEYLLGMISGRPLLAEKYDI